MKAHCIRCKFYKNEYSPMPGESHDRCKAVKLEDGTLGYCSRNNDNNCSEFQLTLNPIKRFATVQQWWRPYM